MSNRPILQLAKLVGGPVFKPWLLIETYLTSEGMRTRVCSGRWGSEEEARAEMVKRQEAMQE